MNRTEAMADTTRRRHSHYALGVLVLVYTFNHLDRQVFGVLIEPISDLVAAIEQRKGQLLGVALADLRPDRGRAIEVEPFHHPEQVVGGVLLVASP